MQSNQIPAKFAIPFGNNAAAGTIRTIPQASQASVTPGAASLTDGFPAVTAQPLASGGVPPSIQDFNGLLNQLSAWARWTAAAGLAPYDSTFSAAVGGYPSGATVLSATTAGRIWISTADNNTTNPDSAGATSWLAIMSSTDLQSQGAVPSAKTLNLSTVGSGTFTVPAGVYLLRRVRMWGGGGGGGGAANTSSAGAGGGPGAYWEGAIPVTPGQAISYTVGAGGAAGAGGASPTAGGSGGATSFGSYVNCPGASGGQAANGGVNVNPGVGSAATQAASLAGFIAPIAGAGIGFQSGSLYGGGFGAPAYSVSNAGPNVGAGGIPGIYPGSGGNGSSANANGGAGAAGLIILDY